MKKTALIISAIAFILISCAKDTIPTSSAAWTIGTHSYSGTTVQVANNKLLFATDGPDTMQVFFSVLPTLSAVYTVVNENKVSANTLGATELAVRYTAGSNDTYLSTGAPAGTTVNVVLTGGSIALVIPTSAVEHRTGSTVTDTVNAGGTIKQ